MDGRKGQNHHLACYFTLQSAKCLFAERADTPAAQCQDSGLDLDGAACAIRFLWRSERWACRIARSLEHTCWA
jgi:hypothetical protein